MPTWVYSLEVIGLRRYDCNDNEDDSDDDDDENGDNDDDVNGWIIWPKCTSPYGEVTKWPNLFFQRHLWGFSILVYMQI